MKFMVLGSGGMAGHTVAAYLSGAGHSVTGFARNRFDGAEKICADIVYGDVKDAAFLRSAVLSGGYDYVVNCVGILNQFAERDKESAVYLNAYLPHYLAAVTSDTETAVIHISTDCVFSGNRGGYTEYDRPDGESFYDRSKALGELDDDKNITLRGSIVGPDMKRGGIGLFNWFMKQSGEINGYVKSVWTGQTTLQLAKTIEAAAKRRIHGLHNTVPAEPITKYELLKLFNKYFKNGGIVINPVDGAAADKSLLRVRGGFDYPIPSYEEMIRDTAVWCAAHSDLYPHYDLTEVRLQLNAE
jgi:dTDP-4-dehydrorhamnose reductase